MEIYLKCYVRHNWIYRYLLYKIADTIFTMNGNSKCKITYIRDENNIFIYYVRMNVPIVRIWIVSNNLSAEAD